MITSWPCPSLLQFRRISLLLMPVADCPLGSFSALTVK